MVMIAGGNRIIGGIGAPGGDMSEAFSTGAGSALDRRQTKQAMDETAQAMRMREQQFQWSIEDRAAAQKRAAAAAAASAAAQGRRQAAMAGVMAAEPFFKLGAQPGAGAAPAAPPRAGVGLPRSMGTVAPASAPAGGGGSGSAGSTPAQPMAGVVARATPSGAVAPFGTAQGTSPARVGVRSEVVPEVITPPRAGQPIVTPQTQGPLPDYVEAPGLWTAIRGDTAAKDDADALLRDGWINDVEYMQLVRGSRGQQMGIVQNVVRRQAGETVPFATGGEEQTAAPAQTVTIRGPNGPVTVPTATATATGAGGAGAASAPPPPAVAPTAPGDLAFPGAAPMGVEPTTTLSFGPRLGAVPSAAEQFLADVGMAPAGQVDLEALAASYNSPLYDPMFAQLAEQQRAAFVFAAQDAAARGDIGGYLDAAAKVREQEMMILTQQLMVGLDEAKNFNSPQRMSQVLSMVYGGADVFVAPKGNGLADIYLDGAPYQMDADLDAVASHVRSQIDGEYRAQMSAAAAEQDAATREVLLEVWKEQMKAAGRPVDPNYQYEKTDDGGFVIFSNGQRVGQLVPRVVEANGQTYTVLEEVR